MLKPVPKNYKCYNCGREQYTNEKCYGCDGKIFLKLENKDKEGRELRKELHVAIEDMSLDQLKSLHESIFG